MLRKNPYGDTIGNKPNKRGFFFPIAYAWDFEIYNGSVHAAPSVDYTPP